MVLERCFAYEIEELDKKCVFGGKKMCFSVKNMIFGQNQGKTWFLALTLA